VRIAAETVKSSAEMVLQSDQHPRQLADNVASPGGTTIEGLVALEKNAFAAAVIAAVSAVIEKENSLL
jgi:pyrroline-5-carboxylate reductase